MLTAALNYQVKPHSSVFYSLRRLAKDVRHGSVKSSMREVSIMVYDAYEWGDISPSEYYELREIIEDYV